MQTQTTALKRRDVLAIALAAGLGNGAFAQNLPSSGRIFVGFAPGAGPDMIARRLGEQLTNKLASAVVVENRTGAAGRIAVDAARGLAADGLTLMLNPNGVVTLNPHTYRKLSYSPFEDLAPVSLVCRYELGFVIGPAVPDSVRSLSEFAAWARSQNKPVGYGSPAAGAPPHFVGDVFSRQQKLDMVHLPYRGAGPMVGDVLGGQIACGVSSLGDLVEQAKGGRLRVLAATGARRSRFYPHVPTFEEQGVSGLTTREWMAVYIAGKPSPEVLARTVALVRSAVDSPAFAQGIAMQGFEAASSSSQELDQMGRADFARYGEIVKASGFAPES